MFQTVSNSDIRNGLDYTDPLHNNVLVWWITFIQIFDMELNFRFK
jgi:hypothetical protein